MSTTSTAPSSKVFAVTPSDSVSFTRVVRQLYVGVGGNITVVNGDDSTATFTNVLGGSILGPFALKRVNATGTTATSIVGFE